MLAVLAGCMQWQPADTKKQSQEKRSKGLAPTRGATCTCIAGHAVSTDRFFSMYDEQQSARPSRPYSIAEASTSTTVACFNVQLLQYTNSSTARNTGAARWCVINKRCSEATNLMDARRGELKEQALYRLSFASSALKTWRETLHISQQG